MMFEKYTVRKAVISTRSTITTIAQGLVTLSIPNKVLANFTKTLVFKIELINFRKLFREFDPGSGRTLAACLTHASRARISLLISSE